MDAAKPTRNRRAELMTMDAVTTRIKAPMVPMQAVVTSPVIVITKQGDVVCLPVGTELAFRAPDPDSIEIDTEDRKCRKR